MTRASGIGPKVDHVRRARQDRNHTCHWPGCDRLVPPAKWGCREHWFRLPKPIRDAIWDSYEIGQEQTLTPSPAYLEAAHAARQWINDHAG